MTRTSFRRLYRCSNALIGACLLAGVTMLQTQAQGPGQSAKQGPLTVDKFTIRGTVNAFNPLSGLLTVRVPVRSGGAPTNPGTAVETFQFKQFKPVTSGGHTYRVGQVAYVTLDGTNALVTAFPITGSRRDDLGHSRKMETSVTLSASGRLDAVTRTWTAEALKGFTGGVVVAITDKDRSVLHTTQLHKYGVNGTQVPGGAKSDRTEKWSENLPPSVANAVGGYAIVQAEAPTDHLTKFLKDNQLKFYGTLVLTGGLSTWVSQP
jgi:hypothetical protein